MWFTIDKILNKPGFKFEKFTFRFLQNLDNFIFWSLLMSWFAVLIVWLHTDFRSDGWCIYKWAHCWFHWSQRGKPVRSTTRLTRTKPDPLSRSSPVPRHLYYKTGLSDMIMQWREIFGQGNSEDPDRVSCHLGLHASLETPKSNDLSYVKCKQAMRTSSAFCVAGWLAIYFAKVCVILLFFE